MRRVGLCSVILMTEAELMLLTSVDVVEYELAFIGDRQVKKAIISNGDFRKCGL